MGSWICCPSSVLPPRHRIESIHRFHSSRAEFDSCVALANDRLFGLQAARENALQCVTLTWEV